MVVSSHVPELLIVGSLTIVVGGIYLIDLLWYRPGRQRLAMEKARQNVERRRRGEIAAIPPSPDDYHYGISFDSVGLTVMDLRDQKSKPITMQWADVSRATAFKRDLYSVDCVCVRFDRFGGNGVEVDEDMAGWLRLLEALPQHLGDCKPHVEWFSSVALPPFAQNPKEIYLRASVEKG